MGKRCEQRSLQTKLFSATVSKRYKSIESLIELQ